MEGAAYLGAFNLLALCCLFIYLLGFRRLKQGKRLFSFGEKEVKWLVSLFFAGFVLLMISWGEKVIVYDSVKVPNLLNPFFYLSGLVEQFRQFRCLGRFNWFFFWGLSFVVLFFVDRIWRHEERNWIRFLFAGLSLCAVLDTSEFIRYQNQRVFKNNLTFEKNTQEMRSLFDSINIAEYQALLPAPFFHVGTENYALTIDPNEPFFIFCAQSSTFTGLPLMGSQMSRTAIYQAEALFTLFTDDPIDSRLQQLLTDRPVLLIYSKKLNNNPKWFKNKKLEPSRTVALGGPDLIDKYPMTIVAENDNYRLYKWVIP